jgi:hypothetical protein
MNSREVKVWNRNAVDHEEKFKGQLIKIPAGEFIKMDRTEAAEFLSQFRQPVYNKGGVQEISSMKKLFIEYPDVEDLEEPKTKENEFLCHKCGFKAKTRASLSSHIKNNHLQALESDEARQEILKGL